jgi:F-type H+-transporting ATPase subunit b
MNLAVTLVIQGVVFFLVAWGVMKFFWPWLMNAIAERQKKIAEGLAAAEQEPEGPGGGRGALQGDHPRGARRAAQIVDQAGKRSNEMVEEAKGTATAEAQRCCPRRSEEVARETTRAREGLAQEVGKLAVEGASRLLGREIDPKTHAELLDKLAAEVARG